MPEYLAPVVYVEEVDGGVRPIEGVDTGTAAIVGLTERGCGIPRLVTCWDEYAHWFGTYLEDLPGAIRDTADRYLPYAVRGFFDNGGRRLVVARVIGAAAGTASLGLDGATVSAAGAGEWGNGLSVEIVAAPPVVPGDPDPTARFTMIVRYVRTWTADGVPAPPGEPDALETFAGLSMDPGDARFAETVVNTTSRLVRLAGVTASLAPRGPERLAGGGHADPDLGAYRGRADPACATGLAALASIGEVSMLAAPGDQAVGLAAELIAHCEARGDRIAILNGPRDAADVARFEPPADTAWAAVWVPWLRVDAPHVRAGYAVVPPCGHVAGVHARVAGERGVHEAPAAELVRGAATSLAIDERDAEVLHRRGVNVIRDVGDRDPGLRVSGGHTMSSDATWKYVNVRRLVIFIEQSIERALQWVVFEPNDEPLWQRVRRGIEPFLETLWRAGAMRGATARDAFFVRCDRTTMTQTDIDEGRLVVLVGVAVVAAAEFVVIRIGLPARPAGVGTGSASSDSLAAFDVVLEVGDMCAGFAEVGGVTSITEYRPDGDSLGPHKLPRQHKFPSITLRRGYTSDAGLWDWYRGALAGSVTRRSGTITLRDEARRPMLVWRFVDAWPREWCGPPSAAADGGITIDALELCAERIAVERCA